MSKFLKVMIVLLTIAAVAAPAFAEDRLSLSGQMRVRGWSLDDSVADGVDKGTATWADERLRVGGKLSIAEGVSVTFRTDITEANWGNGGNEFGSGRMASTQQWDRAHMDLTKGNFHLRAGQQLVTFGLGETMNSQDTGLRFDIAGPVAISGFFMLDDQNGGKTTADSYFFGANASHKTDSYAGNVFIGGQTKSNNVFTDAAGVAIQRDGEAAYLLGADFSTKLGVAALKAELDFFFGDADTNVDAMGTQLFVDASMAASDMVTVGGQLYYALAAGTNEVQYQVLGNDFDGLDPIFDLGTNLHNEQIGLQRAFDYTGDNAGVMGARLYTNLKASDSVDLGASFAYLTPEDDAMTTNDSAMFFAGSVSYKVMANTLLQAQLQYTSFDDSDPDVEDIFAAGAGLFVNF